MLAPTWNEEFELPDGSYSVSDIQNHLETVIDKPSKNIYVNKIENRIIFKIKTGYYVELLMPKTMKLLRSANSKITKDENTENMPCLEITELVLIR